MRTRAAVLAVTACLAGVAMAATVARAGSARVGASSVPNVRVLGRFLMTGKVMVAVGIPGERAGERVTRTWRIRPYDCRESDCPRLVMVRNRGAQRESKLVLRRVGAGEYRGTGAFSAPVKCLGRIDKRGSVAPYVVKLLVINWTQVGVVRYATALAASYVNMRRSDRTRCPLGVVHDAAGYIGILKSALPKAPVTTTLPAPTTPVPAPTVPAPTTPAPTPTVPAPTTTAPLPTPLATR